MQPYGHNNTSSHSNTAVIPYHEYPADMAFSIIDRIAKDMVRGGIVIQSSNKNLRDALYTRVNELRFESACYKYALNYLYGSVAVMTFITLDAPIYIPGQYLSAVKVLSFLPQINPSFQVQIMPSSCWSLAHGEPVVVFGTDRLTRSDLCEITVDFKTSLYNTLKPHTDAVEEMTRGVRTAANRLGMLVGNKKFGDSPQEQEVLIGNARELQNASHGNVVLVDIDEKITNMAMNLNGIKESAEKCYYDISIIAGMPQNVLLGKGKGVAASAVEDFRIYANRIKYEQDLRLRPLYKKLFGILVREEDGAMRDFDPEEIEFEFAPLQAETEKEKAETLKVNLENITTLRSMGIELSSAAAIDDQVSDILQQYSDLHKNTINKDVDKDDAQNNDSTSEQPQGGKQGVAGRTVENL